MIKEHSDGTLLRLYIRPGASKSCWDKVFSDRQKVMIKAPPRDGEANEEVVSFVAKSFGVSKSKVRIIRGETSRNKDVVVELAFKEALEIFEKLQTS